MTDWIINGLLVLVGLVFAYVIILVFVQGLSALNLGDDDENRG